MRTIPLILLSVLCSALAQGLLKAGMSAPAVARAASASPWDMALAAAGSPAVVGGLALYAAGAFVWLAVLARVDLSYAYPFVSLGFVLTLAIGALFFGEAVGAARVAGTVLIMAGVLLVARS